MIRPVGEKISRLVNQLFLVNRTVEEKGQPFTAGKPGFPCKQAGGDEERLRPTSEEEAAGPGEEEEEEGDE